MDVEWLAKRRAKLNAQSDVEIKAAKMLTELGVRFERNVPVRIGRFRHKFVDFAIAECRLFIEIDGPEHEESSDLLREWEILNRRRKWQFLRFTNDEVIWRPDYFKREVMRAVNHIRKVRERKKKRHEQRQVPEVIPFVDLDKFREQDEHLRQIWKFG